MSFAWLMHADQTALLAVGRWRLPRLTRLARAATHLGDGPSWTMLGAVLFATGGTAALYARSVALATLLATAIAQVLKRSLRRPRPSSNIQGFISLVEDPDAFSFPSGHTAAAFAVAIALAGSGSWLGALTLGFALTVGLSRIYLGAHYPLDVAAGSFIGVAAGLVTRLVIGG